MQFINPNVLFAITAVLIPVAIHLFNFRKYKRVFFSNVNFLKELQQKTQKQSQLLHLLVMMLRVLAITALVFAFARPYLPVKKQAVAGQISTISIFVDNSFSMETADTHGQMLDEARIKAAEIASAYKTDDLFQLLTNDFEGKHQRLVTKEEFLEMLADVRLSPSVKSLAEITSRQEDMISTRRNSPNAAYIISDFQRSTIMSSLPDVKSGIKFTLIPVKSSDAKNLYIDSCWFDNPVIQLDRTSVLNVRIKNSSDAVMEKIPVKLIINGRQRSVAAINVSAGGQTDISLPFTNPVAGNMEGMVEISDYPITYDDIYYFVFRVSDRIPVLIINNRDENPYLSSVLGLDSVINISQVPAGKTDYSTISDFKLIILNDLKTITSGAVQEFTRFVSQGGSLLIFPAQDADIAIVNQLFSSLGTDNFSGIDSSKNKVTFVNTKSPVFSDVFEKNNIVQDNSNLPQINRHFRFIPNTGGISETLLGLSNGDPLFITSHKDGGKVYLSAVPANDQSGNWTRHALFVPTMLNIAFRSENIIPLMYYVGSKEAINLGNQRPAQDNVFTISKTDGSSSFIPEYRRAEGQSLIFINNQVSGAGIYEVSSGKENAGLLAFNYDRSESDLNLASEDELNEFAEKSGNFEIIEAGPQPIHDIITSANSGRSLWKWFILTALLCIVAEVLLLRFYGKSKSTAKS